MKNISGGAGLLSQLDPCKNYVARAQRLGVMKKDWPTFSFPLLLFSSSSTQPFMQCLPLLAEHCLWRGSFITIHFMSGRAICLPVSPALE